MKLTGNKCQCSACGECFKSAAAFDKHRKGSPDRRYCAAPESIGMEQREDGVWVTKLMPRKAYFPADTPSRLTATPRSPRT